jgi:hypothetical protein
MKTFTLKSVLWVTTIAVSLLALCTFETQGANEGFVGQTQATHPGGASLNTLHGDCVAEFGPKTRLCTSEEIFKSGKKSGPISEGWVQPLMQFTYNSSGVVVCGVDTTSGVVSCQAMVAPFPYSAGSLNCQGWNSSAAALRGLTYQPANGQFTISSCLTPRPVNCCGTKTK